MNFDEIPKREKYSESRARRLVKQNMHFGQAKLFAALLEFMELTEQLCKFTPVVYIGAAPGSNIAVVAKYYPDTEFLLYDKVPFDKKLEALPNVKLFRKYVDDKEAKILKAKYGVGKTRVFSDIRSLTVEEKKKSGDIQGHVNIVSEDMKIQKSFTDILQPCAASFKFRLPWNPGKTRWFDGMVQLQAYARPFSIETRLFVPDISKTKEYDHKEYEEKMFYFNLFMRPSADKKIMESIISKAPNPQKIRKEIETSVPFPKI